MSSQHNPQLLAVQKLPACPFCTGPIYVLSIYGQVFSINTKYLPHFCISIGKFTPNVIATSTMHSTGITLFDNVLKNMPQSNAIDKPPTMPPFNPPYDKPPPPAFDKLPLSVKNEKDRWKHKRKREKHNKAIPDPHSDRIKIPCRYHLDGTCAKGRDCKYLHVPKSR
jgi:hypothetical protein